MGVNRREKRPPKPVEYDANRGTEMSEGSNSEKTDYRTLSGLEVKPVYGP